VDVDVGCCEGGRLTGMLCSGLLKVETAIAVVVFSGGGGGAVFMRLR
jgi:hypothetical protein